MEYDRRESIYSGKIVNLVRDVVTLPNGVETTLEVILHPGAAVVIPEIRPGVLLCVRQYRHVAQDFLIELPAGKLSPGEDPKLCARRELEEETGHRAGTLTRLTEFWSTPGILREKMHLFLARDLERTAQNLEEDEVIECLEIPLGDALEMIRDGRIIDGKTLIGILYFARFESTTS